MRHSTDFMFTKFFKAYLDDLGIFSGAEGATGGGSQKWLEHCVCNF